jgi:hypothetical protein
MKLPKIKCLNSNLTPKNLPKMKNLFIILLVVTSILPCNATNLKPNPTKKIVINLVGPKKFPATVKAAYCEDKKHLYDAIPHKDNIKEYLFDEASCYGVMLNATYKNPADKNLVFHIGFFDEATLMPYPINYSGAKSSYKLTSKKELQNGFVSDLTTFDNASMMIEKSGKYYHVSYLGTYKDNYSILISIVSIDLSTKEKVDAFLKEYLSAFKKEVLK